MIKEFIGTGKTVEEATAAAKTGLNAPAMADINIEVIAMPKAKVLGLFGGRDAQVKAWYNDTRKDERKPKPKKEAAAKNTAKKEEKKAQPKKEKAEKKPASKPAKAAKPAEAKASKAQAEAFTENITAADIDTGLAASYLKEILSGLSIEDANITARVEDGALQMEVECDDYGTVIGRRGETLDALQYLTSLAVKKSSEKYVRVVINVGDYRERRAETLKNLARKNANYVLRTGRKFTFEPMNPYERRVIHTAIQEIEGVTSSSIGSGQDRRVVLHSTEPRRRNGGSNGATAKRNTAPKSDRADLPKFGKIEINKD